ncbi:MAG: Uma2 family endonuclease [candidate division Zixibacteria bacterium]|nr:Uma2 family endonuclease [candidate division Zixibacteria bacterium]
MCGDHDRRAKYEAYQIAGVRREYWVIDIRQPLVTVFALENGLYAVQGAYGAGENVGGFSKGFPFRWIRYATGSGVLSGIDPVRAAEKAARFRLRQWRSYAL